MFSLFLKSLKYSLVGLINTTLSFLVILILGEWSSLNVYLINTLAYIVGIINSFILNRYWTFKKNNLEKKNKKKIQREFIYFILVFIIAYLIQFFCLWLLIESLKIEKLLSQTIAMVVYTMVGFLLNNAFTFRQKKRIN